MPEHLRALVVILALATAVFVFAKKPACALASTTGDFERRRNLWFAITLTAFLAHNFWIYIIVAAILLLLTLPREPNKLAMYFLLLFAVPAVSAEITGLGVIKHFFAIHYLRLLALAVLLPAFLFLWTKPDTQRFGRSLPDKLIAGYIILQVLLMLTVTTFTNTLRHGVFYAFIDVFLPYYVASRSLKNLQGFRDALTAFVIAALVLSAIGAFEFARHWLLYTSLEDALGVHWALSSYLARGDSLRALASTGHPIVLGYVMAVALGFSLYLRKSVANPMLWGLSVVLLMAGLLASLSRGPWIGAAAILLVFVATGPSAGLRFAILGLLGTIFVPVLLISPIGETIIDHLPFVGTVDESNVTYRQRLLELGIQVVLQNPVFGAFDFIYSPAMQELKQGQGIIDIVNSYLGVALSSGLVGLSLFSGIFIAVAVSILKGMRNVTDKNDERYLLGQALLSVLLGIMIIIFTVSSISVIPVVYWSVAGLGVAYARMLAPAKVPGVARPAGLQRAPIVSGSHLKNRNY
jgi:O-antigen ligase